MDDLNKKRESVFEKQVASLCLQLTKTHIFDEADELRIEHLVRAGYKSFIDEVGEIVVLGYAVHLFSEGRMCSKICPYCTTERDAEAIKQDLVKVKI